MSSEGADALLYLDPVSSPAMTSEGLHARSVTTQNRHHETVGANVDWNKGPRRTPRKSIILVLPENHVLSPDLVTDRLAAEANNEPVDVIVACAGQPVNIGALKRRVRDLQVLLAPAGTGTEELRELAMNEALGDIVTLLSGTPA